MKFSHMNVDASGNRKTSIPLYVRIESLIRNKILNGQLEPGEKLLTEDELIKQFGVSQITIRSSLSNLEREGLIVRNRAKGTFVAENVPVRKKFVIMNKLMIGENPNILSKNETLHFNFNSGIPHRLRNLGDDEAELLIVILTH